MWTLSRHGDPTLSRTALMLLDDARTSVVEAERLRDVLGHLNHLDPRREDPDTRRIIHQIREIIDGRLDMANRLKFLAMQMKAPSERQRVAKLDEVLTEYLEDRADRVARGG